MPLLIPIILIMLTSTSLFDFTPESDISRWRVEDDTVMGGRSDGHFMVNDDGHGRYFGHVSLENDGGFSSLRYVPGSPLDVSDYKTIVLHIKGDGKRYQLRTKSNQEERQSYVQYFETSGDWETVELQLADGTPSWRGQKMDMPNYPAEQLSELGFLIGNEKEQDFELLIDRIELK